MRKQSSAAIKPPAGSAGAMALRGIDPTLRSALEVEAARLGTSLNAAVLRILRTSLGLSETPGLHHDLDALAGAWSLEEAEEFRQAVQRFEEIDAALWAQDPDGL